MNVLYIIGFGFLCVGLHAVGTSLFGGGRTKGGEMARAKKQWEEEIRLIRTFPDQAVASAAENTANQKLRRKLEEILKQE